MDSQAPSDVRRIQTLQPLSLRSGYGLNAFYADNIDRYNRTVYANHYRWALAGLPFWACIVLLAPSDDKPWWSRALVIAVYVFMTIVCMWHDLHKKRYRATPVSEEVKRARFYVHTAQGIEQLNHQLGILHRIAELSDGQAQPPAGVLKRLQRERQRLFEAARGFQLKELAASYRQTIPDTDAEGRGFTTDLEERVYAELLLREGEAAQEAASPASKVLAAHDRERMRELERRFRVDLDLGPDDEDGEMETRARAQKTQGKK